MLDALRNFLARHAFHVLQGMSCGDWLRLLAERRFRVSARCWPKTIFQVGVSLANEPHAWLERRSFARLADAVRVPAPLFVLGHFRSGTTHLHNLLAVDERFAYPTIYQSLNPHTFLRLERWMAPLTQALMLRKRPQDDVAITVDAPNEDEFALMALTRCSPYLEWVFAGTGRGYRRFLTFREASAEEIAVWKAGLLTFFKKLTYKHGRPLVLKSPPHTARIRLLLEVFPNARFVHIHRDPYAVFQSTRHLHRSVRHVFQLERGDGYAGDEEIFALYNEMYDAYFEQKGLIPPGNFCDVGYEELVADPRATLGRIYETLSLGEFENVWPRQEAYLQTIADFRQNRHTTLTSEVRGRIAREWRRSFDEWGYPLEDAAG